MPTTTATFLETRREQRMGKLPRSTALESASSMPDDEDGGDTHSMGDAMVWQRKGRTARRLLQKKTKKVALGLQLHDPVFILKIH